MTFLEMPFMYIIIHNLFVIIKMLAPLVLSVNNRYTGLIRASIRYGKDCVRGNFLTEGGYFLNRKGGK